MKTLVDYVTTETDIDLTPADDSNTAVNEELLIARASDITPWLETVRGQTELENRFSVELKRLSKGDFYRRLAPAPSIEQFNELGACFPNYRELIDWILDFMALADEETGLWLPPALIVGPPGIGKTAFVNAFGDLVGGSPKDLQMSTSSSGFKLGGMDLRYQNGSPGLAFQTLINEPLSMPANRLMFVDEIDKSSRGSNSDPLGAFYPLLETSTSGAFIDESIPIPIDASCLIWIATANSIEPVPNPILSRFNVFDISPPTPAERPAVIASVWSQLRKSEERKLQWAKRFDPEIDGDALDKLCDISSIRTIKSLLVHAAGKAKRAGRTRIYGNDIDDSRLPKRSSRRPIGFV